MIVAGPIQSQHFNVTQEAHPTWECMGLGMRQDYKCTTITITLYNE